MNDIYQWLVLQTLRTVCSIGSFLGQLGSCEVLLNLCAVIDFGER